MTILCKLFGHKWICCMGFESICKRCGITYTEYFKFNKKKEQ